jgi:hypothetical protein
MKTPEPTTAYGRLSQAALVGKMNREASGSFTCRVSKDQEECVLCVN